MDNKFRAIAFVIFIMLIFVATVEAKEFDKFSASLQKCSRALDSYDKLLLTINVSNLPVQYKQGAMLEKFRTSGLKLTDVAQDRINWLKKQKNVTDTLILLGALKDIMFNLYNVWEQLSILPIENKTVNLEYFKIKDEWLEKVKNIESDLSDATIDFVDSANSYAKNVDEILQRYK